MQRNVTEVEQREQKLAKGRAYRKAWKKANPEKFKAEKKRERSRTKQRNNDFVLLLKNRPCADCGQTFHFSAMDFDHILGEKQYEVSRLGHAQNGLTTILAEIDKCEVVCSNCHRYRTWQRRQNDKGRSNEAAPPVA